MSQAKRSSKSEQKENSLFEILLRQARQAEEEDEPNPALAPPKEGPAVPFQPKTGTLCMVQEQGFVPWPVVILSVCNQGFSTRFHCRYICKETHCMVELKELYPLEWGEKFADKKPNVWARTYYFTLAFWEAKKLVQLEAEAKSSKPIPSGG
jgi:hypothetical protein